MNKQFIESLALQKKEQPKKAKVLLEIQKREAEKLKQETENLIKLLAESPFAKGMKSLLNKIKENENHLEKVEQKRQKLEEDALLEMENQDIDPSFVFSCIDKLRKDNFRKAKLSKKRALLRELIKGIYIHPENVLRVDFQASEYHSEGIRNGEKEVVLPFREVGKPLEASFEADASCGVGSGVRDGKEESRQYAEIKKAVGFGTYVLCHDAYSRDYGNGSHNANVVGAGYFRNGCGGRI